MVICQKFKIIRLSLSLVESHNSTRPSQAALVEAQPTGLGRVRKYVQKYIALYKGNLSDLCLPVNGCVTNGSDNHAAAEADNGGQVERVRDRQRPLWTSKCFHFVEIIVIVEKVVNSFGTSYK